MSDNELYELIDALYESDINKVQIRTLIKFLKEILGGVSIACRGDVGVHLDEKTYQNIDRDILKGLSQHEICAKYDITPTTFKRHRKKLYEQGKTIPNYKPRISRTLVNEVLTKAKENGTDDTRYDDFVKRWGKRMVDEYGIEELVKAEMEFADKRLKANIKLYNKNNKLKHKGGHGNTHTSPSRYNNIYNNI